MSINKAIIIGHLGKDPEPRYANNGSAVTTFSVATSQKYKDRDGQQQERTEWHNIVTWGKLAEICTKYLHKGKQVYLEGRIQTRTYDDREGNRRYITEIVAEQITMLGSKRTNPPEPAPSKSNPNQQKFDNPDSPFAADDIPF